jgi:hypothetical protein
MLQQICLESCYIMVRNAPPEVVATSKHPLKLCDGGSFFISLLFFGKVVKMPGKFWCNGSDLIDSTLYAMRQHILNNRHRDDL